MSLLDALLLDPVRVNVWIAIRTDGAAGSGTHNDPYDGGLGKFDTVMATLSLSPNISVHLGPGTFVTNGFYEGMQQNVSWQPSPGMRIVGSGIDVTTLKLADGLAAGRHYYAIGHALGAGSSRDYFEVSELTIDCNLGQQPADVACGAVRVMGSHTRIRHIKAINWGTNSSTRPCLVIAAITADKDSSATADDCGIEECLVVPATATPAANTQTTLLHAGGIEMAAGNIAATGLGTAPFIRNCFVDGGQASPSGSPEIRGLSMAWCKAGLIEGNQAHNLTYGVFQQATNAQDLVVRNNGFKNVVKGVVLGGIGDNLVAGHNGNVTIDTNDHLATVSFTGVD
jgi:hypothetical protein